jgi:hypothetical protein
VTEYDEQLPKRIRTELKQEREKHKKDAADQQTSCELSNATQELVQDRGRWLFNQDRQHLDTLDEADRQTQQSLAQFQRDLVNTRLGEHLFLCLMSLPREIRELVYAAMFEELPTTIIVGPKELYHHQPSDLPRILPPVCYVYLRIFSESVPTLLRAREIELAEGGLRQFGNFLHRIPDMTAFRAVSSLVLGSHISWHDFHDEEESGHKDYFSGAFTGADKLAARCTALRHITLEVAFFDLIVNDDSGDDSDSEPEVRYQRKPVTQIQRDYSIEAITRCPKLRSFKLVCRYNDYHLTNELNSAKEFFEPLSTWLREQLALRAPNVAFEVAYMDQVKSRKYIGFKKQ